MPLQKYIFCGADFGSTIALDLQQKLKLYLHSCQEQMAMQSFPGILSSRVVDKFSSLNFRDFKRFFEGLIFGCIHFHARPCFRPRKYRLVVDLISCT